MVIIRRNVSQRFIVILVLTKLSLVINEESILGGVESSLQIERIWLEFLCDYKTLSFHIWFSGLENLLGLIIFATLITDFFINRN